MESTQPPLPLSPPSPSLSPLLLLSLLSSSPRLLLLLRLLPLVATEAPYVQVQVQVPPRASGRFSDGTRSRRRAACCSGLFVPRMVILSSVRGASQGFIMLQMAVNDVGALMMINWPILYNHK